MNRCFMCKIQAQELWSSLFCLVGVSWVLLYSMLDIGRDILAREAVGGFQKLLMSCLWRERNAHCC